MGNYNIGIISCLYVKMEVADAMYVRNRNWDPCYLRDLFQEEFYKFGDLWKSNVMDIELLEESDRVERYCPIKEDISLDDDTLCKAVENVEDE